jgi:hypothetical protein
MDLINIETGRKLWYEMLLDDDWDLAPKWVVFRGLTAVFNRE